MLSWDKRAIGAGLAVQKKVSERDFVYMNTTSYTHKLAAHQSAVASTCPEHIEVDCIVKEELHGVLLCIRFCIPFCFYFPNTDFIPSLHANCSNAASGIFLLFSVLLHSCTNLLTRALLCLGLVLNPRCAPTVSKLFKIFMEHIAT